jgi:predicted enzyme related to lactoylglutathione lyase
MNVELANSKIVAFVPTRDADRARAFYEEKLGLTFVSDDKFAMVFALRDSMLRIVRVGEFKPAAFTVLGWEVEDIEAAVKDLANRGVAFERYDFVQQDEAGIWDAPGGARVAWFKDPDGNVLSVSQQK